MNPDPGKRTSPRWLATILFGCVLVASCGRQIVTADELTTIPEPAPSFTTTTTTDPAPDLGPTSEQIVAYFDAIHQAEAMDFAAKLWWVDLGQLVDALQRAQTPPARPAFTSPQGRNLPTPAPRSYSGGVAPNDFLACVRNRESRGNYGAVNSSSGAGGAYQFMPSTWAAMGGHGLPQNASPAEQDAMAAKLYATAGRSPWAGPGC